MSIKESFFSVCDEAKPTRAYHVSLYVDVPYYGGPEEGGWWGSDCHIIATQTYPTMAQADAAKVAVDKLADEHSKQAKRNFGDTCVAQMEWLDARGLDADFLPEVDGEERYFVVIEETVGDSASMGERHYS